VKRRLIGRGTRTSGWNADNSSGAKVAGSFVVFLRRSLADRNVRALFGNRQSVINLFPSLSVTLRTRDACGAQMVSPTS
jgi:hypothetical protein